MDRRGGGVGSRARAHRCKGGRAGADAMDEGVDASRGAGAAVGSGEGTNGGIGGSVGVGEGTRAGGGKDPSILATAVVGAVGAGGGRVGLVPGVRVGNGAGGGPQRDEGMDAGAGARAGAGVDEKGRTGGVQSGGPLLPRSSTRYMAAAPTRLFVVDSDYYADHPSSTRVAPSNFTHHHRPCQ